MNNYKKILMGQVDGENIYLSPPSWDCGWYWGFGYLGNNSTHYHLNGLSKNKNLFDAIKAHFDAGTLNPCLTYSENKRLWIFCELVETAYTLKKTAEVLGRGGSSYTTNPIAELIKNKKEVERINKIVLPAIFEEIYKLFKDETK